MDMTNTLTKYLASNDLSYDTIPHPHTFTALATARASNIPINAMAKSVILEDEQGYVMAVIPASQHVKIREINQLLNRHLGLATETELESLFNDCELGAIPPIGEAYVMTTVVDDSLDDCEDIYFESGNHEDVVHVDCRTFNKMMQNSQHACICMH